MIETFKIIFLFYLSYENDKMKYNEIITDFTEKSYKASRELDKLTDEQTKLLKQLEELRDKLSITQAEKNSLQKSLTKEVNFKQIDLTLVNF